MKTSISVFSLPGFILFQINILIIRMFIKLRQILLDNADLRNELEEPKQITPEDRFQIVFETMDQLLAIKSKPRNKYGL